MTSDAKKKLKQECIQIKKIASLKINPLSKEAPSPFKLEIIILAPDDCKVDVTQLVYELEIDSPEEYIVKGFFLKSKLNDYVPREMLDEIEKRILIKYREQCEKNHSEWYLLELVEWTLINYQMLVSCIPTCLEFYMSEGTNGESIRRWALKTLEKADNKEESDEEAREYWRKRREDEEKELADRKDRESEQRRKEIENDPSLFAKVKILSLKVWILRYIFTALGATRTERGSQ